MMPDRIGSMGKVQGVKDSSRPKPKKLSNAQAKLALSRKRAIRPDSSLSAGAAAFVGGAVESGRSTLNDCFNGG